MIPDEPLREDQSAPQAGPSALSRDGRGKRPLDSQTAEALEETFRRADLARREGDRRRRAASIRRAGAGLLRHWLPILNLTVGVYVTLPWLAPVFMRAGQPGPARAIYLVYSTQCHQLPQRSFFLFGSKLMYSLEEIRGSWQDTNQPSVLRQFVGNPEMGWKVAWSDRMVSMYTSLLLAGVGFAGLRRGLRPLPIWALGLFLMPMALDGSTHLVSDFAGLGQGFRDTNEWLGLLTRSALPTSFYGGDALGSFNSWMRLITGALFGVGVVWFTYPQLEVAARVWVIESKSE